MNARIIRGIFVLQSELSIQWKITNESDRFLHIEICEIPS